MNTPSTVRKESKDLTEDQLQSKSTPASSKQEIPLEEIWKITSKTKGSWSQTIKDLSGQPRR